VVTENFAAGFSLKFLSIFKHISGSIEMITDSKVRDGTKANACLGQLRVTRESMDKVMTIRGGQLPQAFLLFYCFVAFRFSSLSAGIFMIQSSTLNTKVMEVIKLKGPQKHGKSMSSESNF